MENYKVLRNTAFFILFSIAFGGVSFAGLDILLDIDSNYFDPAVWGSSTQAHELPPFHKYPIIALEIVIFYFIALAGLPMTLYLLIDIFLPQDQYILRRVMMMFCNSGLVCLMLSGMLILYGQLYAENTNELQNSVQLVNLALFLFHLMVNLVFIGLAIGMYGARTLPRSLARFFMLNGGLSLMVAFWVTNPDVLPAFRNIPSIFLESLYGAVIAAYMLLRAQALQTPGGLKTPTTQSRTPER